MTVECVIPQAFHRTVMGAGGSHVREITRKHEVGIKFPDKPMPNGSKYCCICQCVCNNDFVG